MKDAPLQEIIKKGCVYIHMVHGALFKSCNDNSDYDGDPFNDMREGLLEV